MVFSTPIIVLCPLWHHLRVEWYFFKGQNHDHTPEDGTAVLITFFASCSGTDSDNLKCLCSFCFPDVSQLYLLYKFNIKRWHFIYNCHTCNKTATNLFWFSGYWVFKSWAYNLTRSILRPRATPVTAFIHLHKYSVHERCLCKINI